MTAGLSTSGSPATAEGVAADEFKQFIERLERLEEEKAGIFVFHGLRKNAVTMLLEAGNTEAEVSAIVEMSEQMVRHYSRDVNKRRLAINGMRKLEECWKETRANLFGDNRAH
ncbi:DUF2312 domain-containing protein [Methylobacterium sp. J-030]|uniref:GapR family DNA-binding domain-containing protein n=1 Tax=Methylobacterium sp. J-030 TaxID=2836627 RepID=UPI001FBBFF41|nr:GapR family DNA-binding domain-containing protein [Methylobacterium sp. J-030]MCJ2073234.1 DUF2312 domain-containing protein [Methylobacterium sp. J-030]